MNNPAWDRPGLADREGPLTEWETAAQDYRLDLGWSAWAFEHCVWVLASDPPEALEVPERLGESALNLLRDNGITPPVFIAPDPDRTRWVFLVDRREHTWWRRRDRLTELGVDHIWAGATLHLPPNQFDGRRLEWINQPSLPVPEFNAVADAIIHAASPPGPGSTNLVSR